MKRNDRNALPALLLVLLILSLTGCGSSSKSMAMETAMPETEEAVYEYDTAAVEYSEDASSNGSLAGTGSGSEVSGTDGDIDVEKIIYSANATVETTDFDDSVARLEEMIDRYGGFVESSSTSGSDYYSLSRGYDTASRYASYTIRIPSQHFNTLMTGLSDLGNVPYSYTYTENITSQYYDTQARLNAYQTQEQTLLTMMEQAETVSDLIAIEDKLTDVRYNIESIQSTLKNWDRQVSYSTVNLSLEEVARYTPAAERTFGQRMADSFRTGWEDALSFLQSFCLWLLEMLPTLLFLAAILALFAFIIVRIVKALKKAKARRREKKAAAAPNKAVEETPEQTV